MPEALVCIQSSFSAESTRLVSPFLPPKKHQVSGEFIFFAIAFSNRRRKKLLREQGSKTTYVECDAHVVAMIVRRLLTSSVCKHPSCWDYNAFLPQVQER
jgi:hypothetical protein